MSEWISVKDRLPEKSGKVLVCIASEDFIEPFMTVVEYSAKHKRFNTFDQSENADGGFDDITHWMKLPEPPEEVQL